MSEMFERLTPEARGVMGSAYGIATTSVTQKIETEHLLIGIMHQNPGFLNRFLTNKVSGDPFLDAIQHNLAGREEIPGFSAMTTRPQRTEECERVIALAAQEAAQVGQENIGIDHLLIAILLEENSTAAKMLRERG